MPGILVATDGSKAADRAVDFGAQLAKSLAVPLWIINVTDDFGPSSAQLQEFSRVEHLSRGEMIESLSAQLLAKAKERAEKLGARSVQIESRQGDVTQTIIEIANERDADAVVVGKRGRGSLAGLLLGSVTQKLVSLAPRVVIVVP